MARKDKIAAELASIMDGNDGVLHPQHVVDFARDETTALHDRFEWDDTEAGKKYRLEQARHIIRVYVDVADDSVTEIRAWVSLPSDRETGGGYRKTRDVLSERERREELLQMALRDLMVFKRKYAILQQLAKVFAAAEEVATKHKPKRRRRTG